MAEAARFSLSRLSRVVVAQGTQKVLVVDDDEPLARVMARTLRSRGFECDVALDGAEARRLFEVAVARISTG